MTADGEKGGDGAALAAWQRVKLGEAGAFHELFVEYREPVARMVFRVLGPSADLEDVVQEVFLHVHRSLDGFRGDSKFSTWLYRLTTNVARMHLRKGRSRPVLAFADYDDNTPGHHGSPHDVSERNERVAAFYRLLDELPEKKRTVLVLHDLEGMSAAEIADIVEAPVLTVRTRLFYARKELYSAVSKEPALVALAREFMGGADVKTDSDKPTPTALRAEDRESKTP